MQIGSTLSELICSNDTIELDRESEERGIDDPEACQNRLREMESHSENAAPMLPCEHAERLTSAVVRGGLLLLVELCSLVEERVATRTLLRNCRGAVEVHDSNAALEELRPWSSRELRLRSPQH